MSRLDQARRRWQEVKDGFQPTIRRVRGILGDGNGVVRVPGRPDLVYVRVNADASTIWQVPNDAVADVDNLPVIVEKEPDGGLWRIVEVFRGQISYSGAGWDGVKLTPNHGDEHEWPPKQPGPDPVNIYTRALTDLRSEPTSTYSLNVNVQPIRYNYDGLTKYFKGTTLDLSGFVPGTGIRKVATYLDIRVNAAYAIAGSPVVYSAGADPPVPRLPWFAKPSGLVTLRQNQIEITESDFETVRMVIDEVGVAHNLTASRAPDGNDDYSKGWSQSSIWIFGDVVYVCTSPALTSATWINVSSATGSTALNDLTDVTISSPADTEALIYETSSGLWKNQAQSGGGGGGALEYITKTELTGDAVSIDFSGLSSSYGTLIFEGECRSDDATEMDFVVARFNNDSGSNYTSLLTYIIGTAQLTAYGDDGTPAAQMYVALCEGGNSRTDTFAPFRLEVPNYTLTDREKNIFGISSAHGDRSAFADMLNSTSMGSWRSTTAITRVTFFPLNGSNFVDGTIIKVYGLKDS